MGCILFRANSNSKSWQKLCFKDTNAWKQTMYHNSDEECLHRLACTISASGSTAVVAAKSPTGMVISFCLLFDFYPKLPWGKWLLCMFRGKAYLITVHCVLWGPGCNGNGVGLTATISLAVHIFYSISAGRQWENNPVYTSPEEHKTL